MCKAEHAKAIDATVFPHLLEFLDANRAIAHFRKSRVGAKEEPNQPPATVINKQG